MASGTYPVVYMGLIRSLIGTQGPSGGGWLGEAGSGYCILLGGSSDCNNTPLVASFRRRCLHRFTGGYE